MLWCDKRLKKGELKENSIEKAYRRVELYLFDRFNFSRLLAENIKFKIFYTLFGLTSASRSKCSNSSEFSANCFSVNLAALLP